MRLFVSVDIEELSAGIASVQEPLTSLPGIRCTDPTQAHITLKFLGDSPDTKSETRDVQSLCKGLQTAIENIKVDPFTLRLGELGVFPSLEYISVIWIGVAEGDEELSALHTAIEEQTVQLGYPTEKHEFKPHVTIARMNSAEAKSEVQDYVTSETPQFDPIAIKEIRLKESKLTSEGPSYATIETIEL